MLRVYNVLLVSCACAQNASEVDSINQCALRMNIAISPNSLSWTLARIRLIVSINFIYLKFWFCICVLFVWLLNNSVKIKFGFRSFSNLFLFRLLLSFSQFSELQMQKKHVKQTETGSWLISMSVYRWVLLIYENESFWA